MYMYLHVQCTVCIWFNILFTWVVVLQGDLRPDDAASMLTIFEGKFTRLKDDRDNLIKAKEALELADAGQSTVCDVCVLS